MVESASFKDDGILEVCRDSGLDQACRPILVQLGIWEKVVYNEPLMVNETETVADSS